MPIPAHERRVAAHREGRIPGARRFAVLGRRARVPRVRAHEHDVRQRVHPRADRAASRRASARSLRDAASTRPPTSCRATAACRPSRRRRNRRRPSCIRRDGRHGRRHRARQRVRRAQPHHARHGRHQRRRLADRRRRAAAHQSQPHRAASAARADARHGHDRRRRRLDRVGRRRLRAARRSAQRGLGARAGLLRAGRHATDGDRCESRARPSQRVVLPGRRAHARPRSARREAIRTQIARAARHDARGRGASASSPSPKRTWPTRSGSCRSSAGSIRATSRSSRSAARARLHAVRLAEALSIGNVLVPPAPGNLSAMGLLCADVRHDLARTLLQRARCPTSCRVSRAIYEELLAEADAALAADGVPARARRCTLSADLRYQGQNYELHDARVRARTSRAASASSSRASTTSIAASTATSSAAARCSSSTRASPPSGATRHAHWPESARKPSPPSRSAARSLLVEPGSARGRAGLSLRRPRSRAGASPGRPSSSTRGSTLFLPPGWQCAHRRDAATRISCDRLSATAQPRTPHRRKEFA